MECHKDQYWVNNVSLYTPYMLARSSGDTILWPNMFYADDKILYLIFHLGFTQIATSYMQSLISDIRKWLIKNFLMVNDIKSDALVVSSMHCPPINFPPFIVASDLILQVPSNTICNFEVVFHSKMHVDKLLSSLCLRDMYKVKDCLPMTDYDICIYKMT